VTGIFGISSEMPMTAITRGDDQEERTTRKEKLKKQKTKRNKS
jgi:hypothetical protein